MPHKLQNQQGVATLVVAVVLMLAVFGVTYYMSATVLEETRFVANDIRGKQALQAAQAGIDHAKAIDLTTVTSLIGNSPVYAVSIAEISTDLFEIESTGLSDDGSVERTISYYLAKLPGDLAPPKVPIVSKGTATFKGTVTAINNVTDLTVWTGSAVNLNGAVDTYVNIDGVDNQLSTTASSYGPDVVLGDENLKNAESYEVLESFYGASSFTELRDNLNLTEYTDDNYNDYCVPPNLKTTKDASGDFEECTNNGVYYEGDVNGNTVSKLSPSKVDISVGDPADNKYYNSWLNNEYQTEYDEFSDLSIVGLGGKSFDVTGSHNFIGTPNDPVMIVSSGTISVPSNTVIFGTIVAQNIILNGNTVIYGGLVAIDDTTAFDTAGTNFIKMDKVVMSSINPGGEGFGPVKSSWKDW